MWILNYRTIIFFVIFCIFIYVFISIYLSIILCLISASSIFFIEHNLNFITVGRTKTLKRTLSSIFKASDNSYSLGNIQSSTPIMYRSESTGLFRQENALSPINKNCEIPRSRPTSAERSSRAFYRSPVGGSVSRTTPNGIQVGRSPKYSLAESPDDYSSSNNHSRSAGVGGFNSSAKTAQTVAGPLLASVRNMIDMQMYTDLNSPGLSSRIIQYNEAYQDVHSRRTMTMQPRYRGPGQLPLVQLNKAPMVKLSSARPSVTVRIASPDNSSYSVDRGQAFGAPKEHRPLLPTSTESLHTPTRSVLDALKEISRKRIHAHDDEGEISKRLRKEPLSQIAGPSPFSRPPISKRPRDERDGLNSPNISPAEQPSKRSRNLQCNDIVSSLSSSMCIAQRSNGSKRKADCSLNKDMGKYIKRTTESVSGMRLSSEEGHADSNNDKNHTDQIINSVKLQNDIVLDGSSIEITFDENVPTNKDIIIPKLTLFNKVLKPNEIVRYTTNESENNSFSAPIAFIKPKKKSTMSDTSEPMNNMTKTKLSQMLSCLSDKSNKRNDTSSSTSYQNGIIPSAGVFIAPATVSSSLLISAGDKTDSVVSVAPTITTASLAVTPIVSSSLSNSVQPKSMFGNVASSATTQKETIITSETSKTESTSAVAPTTSYNLTSNANVVTSATSVGFGFGTNDKKGIDSTNLTVPFSNANTNSKADIGGLDTNKQINPSSNSYGTNLLPVSASLVSTAPRNNSSLVMSISNTPFKSSVAVTTANISSTVVSNASEATPPSFLFENNLTRNTPAPPSYPATVPPLSNAIFSSTSATVPVPLSTSAFTFGASAPVSITNAQTSTFDANQSIPAKQATVGGFKFDMKKLPTSEPVVTVAPAANKTGSTFTFGGASSSPSSTIGIGGSSFNPPTTTTSAALSHDAAKPIFSFGGNKDVTKPITSSITGSDQEAANAPKTFSFGVSTISPKSTNSLGLNITSDSQPSSNLFNTSGTFGVTATRNAFNQTSASTNSPSVFGTITPELKTPSIVENLTHPASFTFGSSTAPAFVSSIAPTSAISSNAAPAFGTPSIPGFCVATTSSTSTFGVSSTATPNFGTGSSSTSIFGVGNTAPLTFGSTATATPTFGPTSSATPTFGPTSSATPTFGSTSSATPAFGPTSSATPTFGPTSSATPAFGPASTTTSTFGITTSVTPTFGSANSVTTTFVGRSSAAPSFGVSTPIFGGGNPATSTFGTGTSAPLKFGVGSSVAPPQFGSATAPMTFLAGSSATSTVGAGSAANPMFGSGSTAVPIFGGGSSAAQTFGGGNSATPAFGGGISATPIFGGSSATPAFGGGSSGAPAFGGGSSATPAFGAGSNATPAFGAGSNAPLTFGSVTSATPAFGSGSSAASTFGVGNTTKTPFGAGNSATPSFGTGYTTAQAFGESAISGTPNFGVSTSNPQTFSSTSSMTTAFGTPTQPQVSSTFSFGTPNTTPPKPAFAFGSGNSATPTFGSGSSTTNPGAFQFGSEQRQPASAAFNFGSAAVAPNINFTAGNTNQSAFGTQSASGFMQPYGNGDNTAQFGGQNQFGGATQPNFGASAPGGMFSIGAGGSATPRSRATRTRRQR